MRILITGGNGFLGSNLIKTFLELEYELLVISRNNNNIKNNLDKIQFIKYDSIDYTKYQNQILEFNPELVIHLAWNGGNSYYDINDTDQISKNIPSGLSLLEVISKQKNKPTFMGFGSFSEYGNLKSPAKEDQLEIPDNFYGLSKNLYRTISKLYCDQRNINWIWIRPCYIYGGNDAPNRLIPTVINKKLNNKEVILDSCDKTIDYLYIDDFCSAILEIINSKAKGVYNVCSGKEYDLKYILDFIDFNINSQLKILYLTELNRELAPKYICGSNEKLKIETGWIPKIGIEDGILKTIEHYKYKKEN